MPASSGKKSVGQTTQTQSAPETLQAKLRRRLEVCDRLKILALETNDSRLEQAASELEDLVWQWYWQEQRQRPPQAQPVSPARGERRLGLDSSPTTIPERPLPPPKTGLPATDSSASGVRRPGPRTSASNATPVGIPHYERIDRLDVHTIRGSVPDSSPPVVDLLPAVNRAINTSEEMRR